MPSEIGEKAQQRISESGARQIREAIEEVGGREVFCSGRLNADGLVEKIKVHARGHEGAVPAFHHGLGTRDVVIHNHPGGDIAPSEADLQLASIFGFNGHGVLIVDNDVTRVYVIVEPAMDSDKSLLNPDELGAFLGPDGDLAKRLDDFEIRPQQVEMMQAAARAFNTDGIAVVEAPTGVGKTIAYLVPAVMWAVRNRERVVVSTNTINLQEQIIEKDIPLLARCLGVKFSAVLVKGRRNYLCWRKLNRALSENALLADENEGSGLQAIADWADKTEDGTRSDLAFVPSYDLWDRVCSDGDTCRPSNCPDAKRCFIGKARRDVAKADIIVANHHMLFSDIAIKKETGNFTSLAVLPAYRRVVFDEAHNVENSATEYFGAEVTRNGIMNLLGRLIHVERSRSRGLLSFLRARLAKGDRWIPVQTRQELIELIDSQVLPAIAGVRDASDTAFGAIRNLTAERCRQIGRDIKWRLTPQVLADEDLREVHSVYVLPAVAEIHACARLLGSLHAKLKQVEAPLGATEPPFVMECLELAGYRERLVRSANTLAEGTSEELPPDTVRWIEIDARNKSIVRLVRCPLSVAEPLAEWVYANLKTAVLTSATLTVRRDFDFLFSRIGLGLVGDRSVETLMLDSPFDFQAQALLGIPTDHATPDQSTFLDECVDHIREVLTITRGHAFVLFTSFHALDYSFKRLEGELKSSGITPLRQGVMARTQLLERFRSDPASVLFGTDSFWEGVDVAGEALQCVILPKLPFRVPTEPILEARAEALEAAGGNSFMQYTVPQAVIKFRQGFGRLIRRTTDRGTIIVLDRRVVAKHYGRVFLDSLPDIRIVKGPRRGVYLALRKFFDAGQGTAS
jgi:ATP-dependent DNA helicase DinG